MLCACGYTLLLHSIYREYRVSGGSNPVTSAGDRADILCVLQDSLLLSDASVTHCFAVTYVEMAAATAGSAAEVRAAKKVAKYA